MTRTLSATLPNGETFSKVIKIKDTFSCNFAFAIAFRYTVAQLREDARQFAIGLERDAAYRLREAEKATDEAQIDRLLAEAARSESRAAEQRLLATRINEPSAWEVDHFTRYAETVTAKAADLRRNGDDVAILRFDVVISK